MDKFFLWVERLLIKFSYAGKTRFICFLGIFYAIFLIVEIFYVHHNLKTMFQKKSIGLSQYRELSELLEYSLGLKIRLGDRKGDPHVQKESEALVEKINMRLKHMNASIQKETSAVPFLYSRKIVENNLLIDKVTKQWESIWSFRKENKPLPILALIAFSNSLLDAIEQNMQRHSLKLGVQMSVVLLSDIAMVKLLNVQNMITNIAIIPLQIRQGMATQEARLRSRDLLTSLQFNMNTIMTEMSIAMNEIYSEERKIQATSIMDLFQYYEKLVKEFVEYFNDSAAFLKTSLPLTDPILQEGWKLEDSLINFLEDDVKKSLGIVFRRQVISFAVLSIGLLAFLLMYMTRLIRRPLERLKHAAVALAEGDLSVRVPLVAHDEVAILSTAFNQMAEGWEKSLIKAKTITLRLVNTSVSIFDIVKDLERNVENQEASVESMGLQAKEISATTQKFNEVLKEVNKSISVTSNLAETGRLKLSEMEVITQHMKEASRLIVDTLELIGTQVDKINGVLITVVSIADQSNLLSLNTAIRASQTGIKGVGFAVVAGKIRELADRTAFATLDIEQTVQDIVRAVSKAVLDVEKFSAQILDQVVEERKISEQLKVRIEQTQEQIKVFDKIQKDMDLQFKESLQIEALINELVKVTKETGKSARKLKQDAKFLYQGTQNLQAIIDRFHFRQ